MSEIETSILAMEKSALDRWGKGDPSGFLEICDPDVVYFDNMVERSLDGLEALRSMYGKLRGKISMERFELGNPKIQLCGDAAVLTYNFTGYAAEKADRWNCTEVYRRAGMGWRIIHTHWSKTAA